MFEDLRSRVEAIGSRLRRLERRELRELRAWLESTRNLIHLSVILLVPLLIAAVTAVSNAVSLLPFLLFPPLASGTYTLFADPNSAYASPRRFVGGLTAGALCGWIALEVAARYLSGGPPGAFGVHASAAAFAVFLTGTVTWLLDLEESQAFSTALLVLVIEPVGAFGTPFGTLAGRTGAGLAYVLSVLASTTIVAAAFVGWRRWFFERRARLLYASTTADDAVLVPMRGEHPEATAMLGARLAAAHEAGKVVLLDVVDRRFVDDAALAADDGSGAADRAEERAGAAVADPLEAYARRIESTLNVPCQVVVAAGDETPVTVLEAAREADCDLVVIPGESDGSTSPFVRELVHADFDVVVHRSADSGADWERVLVPVRSESDVSHAMVDFATRLVGPEGTVTVSHCLTGGKDRRRAEEMLARLVEPFDGDRDDTGAGGASGDGADGTVETHVAAEPPERFVVEQGPLYDLVLVGASADRSSVSRFVSAPTAERLADLECDLAVVSTARG